MGLGSGLVVAKGGVVVAKGGLVVAWCKLKGGLVVASSWPRGAWCGHQKEAAVGCAHPTTVDTVQRCAL